MTRAVVSLVVLEAVEVVHAVGRHGVQLEKQLRTEDPAGAGLYRSIRKTGWATAPAVSSPSCYRGSFLTGAPLNSLSTNLFTISGT